MASALQTLLTNQRVERLVQKDGVAKGLVSRFVAGTECAEGVAVAQSLRRSGFLVTLDLLGEDVDDAADADAATRDYLNVLAQLERTGGVTLALKLSQLGLNFEQDACADRLLAICASAESAGTSVELDMEGSATVDQTLDVYERVHDEYPSVRIALQAYLRRTPLDLMRLEQLSPRVRLVKGAYAEPRSIALQTRDEIDAQYAFLSDWICEHGTEPAFATHDARLIEHAHAAARRNDVHAYEVQMLYGVRRDFQNALAAEGLTVRVYVPFGAAWYPYLSRRLLERPSNLRFFLRALAGR